MEEDKSRNKGKYMHSLGDEVCYSCINFKTMILTPKNIIDTNFYNIKDIYEKVDERGYLKIWYCHHHISLSRNHPYYLIHGNNIHHVKIEACPMRNT